MRALLVVAVLACSGATCGPQPKPEPPQEPVNPCEAQQDGLTVTFPSAMLDSTDICVQAQNGECHWLTLHDLRMLGGLRRTDNGGDGSGWGGM